MNLLDPVRARIQETSFIPPKITTVQVILVAILLLAAFTRFWRLGTPDRCYFDELYFPTTGAEILRGDRTAWNFFGHENTHPPLSKLFMAGGMAIWGHEERLQGDYNDCWQDTEDEAKKNDPAWIYKSFGWRFFGALAGVGAVLFMFLLARKLFDSDVAGLAAALLLTVDGLALAQSRIATPDSYVLFFVLGTVYFLVSERFLFSGIFFGAALATKWTSALVAGPIVIYFIWRLVRGLQQTRSDQRLKTVEAALLVGLASIVIGFMLAAYSRISERHSLSDSLKNDFLLDLLDLSLAGKLSSGLLLPGIPLLLGALIIGGVLAKLALDSSLTEIPRSRMYLEIGLTLPLFFVLAPLLVYLLTYTPMIVEGYSLDDVRQLNEDAYRFHSTLEASHPYESHWNTWPLMGRPVYLYNTTSCIGDQCNERIYSLGNPIIFWAGLVALAFVLWTALRRFRARLGADGVLAVDGRLKAADAAVLFVVLSYIGLWLPLASLTRATFIYHYLPALSFVILALAYCVHRLLETNNPGADTRSPLRRQAPSELIAGLVLLEGGAGLALAAWDADAPAVLIFLPGIVAAVGIGLLLLPLTQLDRSLVVGLVLLEAGVGGLALAASGSADAGMPAGLVFSSMIAAIAGIGLLLLPLARLDRSHGVAGLSSDPLLRRTIAIGFLTAAVLSFIYFYPHLSTVAVPNWLERTYYWDPLGWLVDSELLGSRVDSPFNWR